MAETAKREGMELEPVMSFHKCGGNVGDSCLISLPPWVLEEAKRIGRDKVFYCDRWVGGWVGGWVWVWVGVGVQEVVCGR